MDRRAQFHTREEVIRVLDEQQSKKTWGRWTLDEDAPRSLDARPYTNGSPYQIVLFKQGCGFPGFTAWLGRWVQHLQEKGWVSYRDLWDFVDAAQTIFRRDGVQNDAHN